MSPAASNPSDLWQEISAKKRAALEASIPQEWRVPDHLLPHDLQADVTQWPETSAWFTPAELAITNSTASELLPKLASGRLSSVEVTKAFSKRAVAAHQLTNCLSETCFDRALERAQRLDAELAKTGRPVGALHGLPISLKDNFKLKGLDSTVGFASHVGDASESDSTLAQLLEAAGAVFYVKTNVPTAMMIAETVNNVFGRTVNPRHRLTTSGGSSGGESALIAMKGSVLGVGSDIGGSLRIPAACTGLYTIRPSAGRFPVRNCRSGMPGQEAVQSVNGPLAHTLDDVELYSRALIGKEPWLHDPRCLPIPWREVQLPRSLKIAIMWHDNMVRPTPPITRALRIVKSKLESAGHELVEWDPVDQKQGNSLLGRMFVADGGTTILNEFKRTGEPGRPEMAEYANARDLSSSEMWKLQLERTEYQNRYMDRWNEAGIDAILCPTIPFNTVRNGAFRHVGYTGVYNVLDYSATSFVTGLTVDKAVDKLDATYEPLSENCKIINKECICAGKKTVAQYLVEHHGFKHLYLQPSQDGSSPPESSETPSSSSAGQRDDGSRSPEGAFTGVLSSSALTTQSAFGTSLTLRPQTELQTFSNPQDLLDYVTKRWRSRFVTTDIDTEKTLDVFVRRPFFLLLSVDAPLTIRWQRCQMRSKDPKQREISLEGFVKMNDSHLYDPFNSIQALMSRATVRLLNTSSSLAHLYATLGKLDIPNPDRLRPGWDTYFMELASLAAQRSNCMKRRVGCVLVGKERRVISTGYNGTPRGLRNCAEGGCPRCNDGNSSGVGLATCLCLHAEENALLEAGRERIREGSILYCDTCPCLTCSIKVCQVGISEVVYAHGYSMDTETAEVFRQAGVKLRQFIPPPNGLIHLEKMELY